MGRGRSFPSLTRGPRHFPTSFLASYSRLFTLLSLGDRSFAPSFMLHFRHSTSLSPPSSRYETRNDECNEGSDEASNRHGNRGPVHEERCEGKRNGPNLCFHVSTGHLTPFPTSVRPLVSSVVSSLNPSSTSCPPEVSGKERSGMTRDDR